MSKTHNMKLNHAARHLCKKLRKSQTRAELIFWKQVRNRKFMGLKFYRQFPIFYQINNRESFFISDFFCFDKKTVIEIDGKIHDFRQNEDEERSAILNNMGIRVVRISNEEIFSNLANVLKDLLLIFED